MRAIPLHRLLLMFALLFLGGVQVQAQRTPKIKGNRKVTELREQLPPFRHLKLQADLEVRLESTGSEGYDIRADENLIDVLRLEVRDSTLYISSFYKITGSKALDITVSFKELESVTASAGYLYNESPFQSELLDLSAEEDARLNMEFRASLCRVSLEGNGKADLRAEADSLSVILKERSDAFIYTVNDAMQVRLTDQSGLELEGISGEAAVEADGNAGIKGTRMEATTLHLTTTGSANARVRAMDQLELDASGGSRTYLYGTPKIEILRFTDRAELHKEEE